MSNELQKSDKTKSFFNHILGILSALFMISISVIITLNLTFIYKWTIYKYNLSEYSNLTLEELMINYKELIIYLQNPFINKLELPNFSMSNHGEIHFEEVKRIFMYINIYIFLFMIILGIYFLIKDKIKDQININFKHILNISSNYILMFFTFLISCILVDFSEVFKLFHKIIFKNNYWIFDPKTDPIIDVLPEDFFMIMSLVILILILLQVMGAKIYYYKKLNYNK